jgi:hypothetical protein
VKLVKSATETLEMLAEAFGEHSLSWTAVSEWHSRFKAGRVLVEDDKRSGQRGTSKMTENVEKIENSSTKTVAEQSRARRHRWEQLWSFPGDLNKI